MNQHTIFTNKILPLIGSEEVTRKQLARWIGKSPSYVDQRFSGERDWGSDDVLEIVRRAFELEIVELTSSVIPKGKVLLDIDHMNHMIDGDIAAELKELQKEIGHILNNWDEEKGGSQCKGICHRGIRLLATIQKEFEVRK